jgi:hypothetical protein
MNVMYRRGGEDVVVGPFKKERRCLLVEVRSFDKWPLKT